MLQISGGFLTIFFLVWVLLFALNRVFFSRVKRIRDRRSMGLKRYRETAEQALEAYDRAVRSVEQSLREARAEAERIRESLGAEALREKAKLLEELGAEYRRNVAAAKEELRQKLLSLEKDMDRRVDGIAEKIEERLLS